MALQVEMYLLVTISISLPMPELLTKVSCRKDCKRTSTESSPTSPRLQKRSRDFFFPLSDHNHQVNYFVAIVRAGYVRVAIIHRTLTWTTGSLTCAQMLMHAIAHGVYGHRKRVCTESWLWEENPSSHRGIEPSSVAWRADTLTNWTTSHPLNWLNWFPQRLTPRLSVWATPIAEEDELTAKKRLLSYHCHWRP